MEYLLDRTTEDVLVAPDHQVELAFAPPLLLVRRQSLHHPGLSGWESIIGNGYLCFDLCVERNSHMPGGFQYRSQRTGRVCFKPFSATNAGSKEWNGEDVCAAND